MKEELFSSKNDITDKTKFSLVSKSLFWLERLSITSPSPTTHYHYHDCYELYYLYSGERYYFIKDKVYHIQSGSLVLINSYDIHCTSNFAECGYERILINFKESFLHELVISCENVNLFECFQKNIPILNLNLQEQYFVEGIFQAMTQEYITKDVGYNTYIKAALAQLLLFINRQSGQPDHKLAHPANATHKTISEVIRYINNNYNENITLGSISELFFFSPCYFSRIFKRITGFTFIEYLNAVRIKEAQTLLRKTSLNIAEIAEMVGYKSNTHFGRIFKEITGISPQAYRKYNNTDFYTGE